MAVAPEALTDEVQRYKDALCRAFESIGKQVVFFERNFRTSHAQIQAVPIPKSVELSQLKRLFDESAADIGECTYVHVWCGEPKRGNGDVHR